MNTQTTLKQKKFRNHVLSFLQQGVKNEERFEDLASILVQQVSNSLLISEDYEYRKKTILDAMRQLEEAQKVRRYNMMHESPRHNKQLHAALNHLTSQFKLQFARYI